MAKSDRKLDTLVREFSSAETLKELPQVVDVTRNAPLNPPEAVQARFVGASYVPAYEEAASFVNTAEKWWGKTRGGGLASANHVIDFGSGWGRISRMLLARVAPAKLFAVDVDLEMTALVGTTLPGLNVMTVDPLPPTVFGDGVADAALAFSVFSHLSPQAHEAWAQEFGRVIAPKGMVFITVLDSVFFDQVKATKDAVAAGSTDAFALSLSQCFPDLAETRRQYSAGEPAYAGLGGGGVLTGDYYGWAAVPPEYVKRVWGHAGFDVVEWVPSGTLFQQAMVGLVRRGGGERQADLPRPKRPRLTSLVHGISRVRHFTARTSHAG